MGDSLKSFLIAAAGWFGISHRDAIAAVREAGFGGVEILCKPGFFEHENPAHVEEVRAALANWPDAVVTFHAPFHTVDLSSTDPAVWDHAVDYVSQSLRVASSLRAESATVHTRGGGGPEAKEWADGNFAAFRRALDVLAPIATECNVTLSVENMPGQRFTAKSEELLDLIEPYPEHVVGVCIDTGHAHLAGDVVQTCGGLATRTFVMHIHDNNNQGRDDHAFPGQGTIPWRGVIRALQQNGYRGRNVIEYVERDAQGNSLAGLREKLQRIRNAIENTGLIRLNGRSETK